MPQIVAQLALGDLTLVQAQTQLESELAEGNFLVDFSLDKNRTVQVTAPASLAEGASSQFTIELGEAAPRQGLTLLYAISGTATPDVDYTLANASFGELYIEAGETQATLDVTGNGADRLMGHIGDDGLLGQTGEDYLSSGSGHDSLTGDVSNDYLSGESENDTLVGGVGDDFLEGGDGQDFLMGEAGNDWLLEDAGADLLLGGPAQDVLNGGEGADVFFLSSPIVELVDESLPSPPSPWPPSTAC